MQVLLLLYLLPVTVLTARVKRIVGGKRAEPHRHPWQVYLELTELDGSKTSCGGSIVGPRHVVTAAHCLTDSCGNLIRKATVHLGAYDVCEEDWIGTHKVRPKRFHIYPGFDPRTNDNDIAILELKRDIRFGPKVRMVRLPSKEAIQDCQEKPVESQILQTVREECAEEYEDGVEDAEYHGGGEEEEYEYDTDEQDYVGESLSDNPEYDGDYQEEYGDEYSEYYDEEEVEEEYDEDDVVYDFKYKDNCTTFYDGRWSTVVGWGSTHRFDGSCTLREAKLKIYPNHDELCQDEDGFVMDEDKVCAYNPDDESDSCQGDSGSGLLVTPRGESPILVGVVSYGYGCGEEDSPGVYARIQHFSKWIIAVMTK